MSPDRAPAATEGLVVPPPPASAGWLEVALPLWHRRWWLLLTLLVCAGTGLALGLTRPVRYTGQASFVVQPVLRPSPGAAAGGLPALAGLIGGGTSAVDLHVAILRSQAVADRIIERFDLQRIWAMPSRTEAQIQLSRRVAFGVGRRDGVVQVTVEDELAPRAAAMANEYVEELRLKLRTFAQEEARQRRQFYEAQLAIARTALEQAQKRLQSSGYDRAALRTEPRAAAESYGRMQAEVSAAELRLAAVRRLRAEGSAEVQQALADLAALRAQLAAQEAPKDDGPGSFVARVRDYRYAETLAESIARQAEGARVDEASEQLALQVLDRALRPEWPSSPRPLRWVAVAACIGLGLHVAWVLLRHRMALARLDPAYLQRLALIRSALPRRGR